MGQNQFRRYFRYFLWQAAHGKPMAATMRHGEAPPGRVREAVEQLTPRGGGAGFFAHSSRLAPLAQLGASPA